MKKAKKKKAMRAAKSGSGTEKEIAVIGSTGKKPAKAAKVARTVGRGTDPKRVAAILAKLDEAYPAATCELKHENGFQLLVSTILSAHGTDARVNQVTQTLYNNYPNAQPFPHLTPSHLPPETTPPGFLPNTTKS